MGSYEPVVALMRGLEVLRYLNEQGTMSVGQIHEQTGIAKPTVVRILETLMHAGYVQQNAADRRYGVTARVLSLSNGYDAQSRLMKIASPILDAYRQKVGWPIELAVFDTDAMVILDTSRKSGYLAVNRKPGSRVPVLRTALGRAYLAALAEPERAEVLARLRALPGDDFKLARQPADWAALVGRASERHYAIADMETLSNGRALASAILFESRPVASVNIVVHAAVMSLADFERDFGPVIRSIADEITLAL